MLQMYIETITFRLWRHRMKITRDKTGFPVIEHVAFGLPVKRVFPVTS